MSFFNNPSAAVTTNSTSSSVVLVSSFACGGKGVFGTTMVTTAVSQAPELSHTSYVKVSVPAKNPGLGV